MKIVTYNRKQLQQFIESDKYKKLEHIPISPIRALSQINNPRTLPNDTLLIAIYVDNQLAAYVGALPDDLWIENTFHHFAWMSCIWVNPEYKSLRLFGKLLQEMNQQWENVASTNYVPFLEQPYLRTGMFQGPYTQYLSRFYFRLQLAEILSPKHKLFAKAKRLIQWVDKAVNLLLDVRFRLYTIKPVHSIELNDFSSIPEELLHTCNSITSRTKEELNWIVQFPWISINDAENTSNRYYFSSYDTSFKQKIIAIKKQDQIISVSLLTIRNSQLHVAYFLGSSRGVVETANQLMNIAVEEKIHTVTIMHDELRNAFAKQAFMPLFSKLIQRNYLLPSKLVFNTFTIQSGDGDVAFT